MNVRDACRHSVKQIFRVIVELSPYSFHPPGMTSAPLMRASRETDVPAIADIYAHYVRHSTASFETDPPDVNEMVRRREETLERGLPYLVTEIDGAIVAYAYANLYRPRPAYRFSVEDSIYVHPNFVGRGVGRLLLAALIDACEKAGCRQMIAVIAGSDNAASVRLHRGFGFEQVGVLHSVGFKLGAWVSTMLMQRRIGCGNTTHPS